MSDKEKAPAAPEKSSTSPEASKAPNPLAGLKTEKSVEAPVELTTADDRFESRAGYTFDKDLSITVGGKEIGPDDLTEKLAEVIKASNPNFARNFVRKYYPLNHKYFA